MKEIINHTRELYIVAKGIEAKPNDPEYNKLINQNALTMLNEIEQVVNSHLDLFLEYEKFEKGEPTDIDQNQYNFYKTKKKEIK